VKWGRTFSLAVRRVVAAARDAMDHQVVDLPVIGVHQDRVAMAARVIDCMRAGDQDGRRADDCADAGRGNDLEAYFWVHRLLRCAQGAAPSSGGSTTTLSHRRLAQRLPVILMLNTAVRGGVLNLTFLIGSRGLFWALFCGVCRRLGSSDEKNHMLGI